MLATAPRFPSTRTGFEGRLAEAAAELWDRAAQFDCDGADPVALCEPLRRFGLFVDALPAGEGGCDLLDKGPLANALMMVGGADLSAGRIFEGHVNAVKLVFRYGDDEQRRTLAEDIRGGAVCGVWNAETPPGLSLIRDAGGARLAGRKIYCSGLGLVTRPLITARLCDGAPVMLAPRLKGPLAHDLSGWTVQGMRATATGTVDFDGLEVSGPAIVGQPGDYYRAPLFKGGAWRFAAVQTGALLRLAALMRAELRARGRDCDPHQMARLGGLALAAETAELWVARAACMAEDADQDPAATEAYVNLARLAVEKAALEGMGLAQRGLGLSAFTRPNPVERVVRDLSTYLRQPFPDGALEDAATYASRDERGPPWSAAWSFPQ